MSNMELKATQVFEKEWIKVSSDNICDLIHDDGGTVKNLSEQNLISRSLDDLHLHISLSNDRSELISLGKHQRHYCFHILNHFEHHHGV